MIYDYADKPANPQLNINEAMAAFDALLPAPKYVKLSNSKKTEYIIVSGRRVSFTSSNRSGGAWASYHTFKKMFHDIVKEG